MPRTQSRTNRDVSPPRFARGIAIFVILSMLAVSLGPLAGASGHGSAPSDCGSGSGAISGSVRVVNVTNVANVKVAVFRPGSEGQPPVCAEMPPTPLAGDDAAFASGVSFSITGLDTSAPYTVLAWLDNNTDGQFNGDIPELGMQLGGVSASDGVARHLAIDGTPNQAPANPCAGTSGIGGSITVTGTPPSAPLRVHVATGGCHYWTNVTGDVQSGAAYQISNLPPASYLVEAWYDANNDLVFQTGEGGERGNGTGGVSVGSSPLSHNILIEIPTTSAPGGACAGTGSIAGTITLDDLPDNGRVLVRAMGQGSSCLHSFAFLPGNFSSPQSYAFANIAGTYNVDVVVDLNNNNNPDAGELAQLKQNVDAAANLTNVNFQFAGFFTPPEPSGVGDLWVNSTAYYNGSRQPAGVFFGAFLTDEPAPVEMPADCFPEGGEANVAGSLTITGDAQFDPSMTWLRAVGQGGCIGDVALDGPMENGAKAFNGTLNGAYAPWTLTAYLDTNGNMQFDEGEANDTETVSTLPATDVAFSITLSGHPPFAPDPSFIFGTFGTVPAPSAPASLNVTGFTPGNWSWFAWLETDQRPGPGAFEPIGFTKVDGADVDPLLIDANRTDVVLEFREAPEDGWPADMLPSEGPGGPGGDGGPPCMAQGGGYANGTVTDGRGNVVFDAGMEFVNLSTNQRTFWNVQPDGTFSCQLAPGPYRIDVHSPMGFAFREFNVTAGNTTQLDIQVSFNARPPYQRPTTFYGGTVWGNVSVGGSGVDGVRVRLFPAFDEQAPPPEGGDGGTAPPPHMMCEPRDSQRNTLETCGGEAETNSSGTFVFTYLGDGAYDLEIEGDNVPSTRVPRAVTVSGANNTTVLQLSPIVVSITAATIRGFVNYSSGEDSHAPAAGVDVMAFRPCQPGEPCGPPGWTQTASDGAYSLTVTPGDYGMSVMTGFAYDGPALASVDLQCFPGAETCVNVTANSVVWRNFTMTRGSVLTGVVNDSAGEGVRAFINAMKCDEPQEGGHFGPPPCDWAWGQTDVEFGPHGPQSSGHYNITLAQGRWEIRIEPDRWERPDLSVNSTTVEINGSENWHNVTLGAGARVRGTITAGGAPVTYVNVFASVHDPSRPPGGHQPPVAFGFANESGSYDLSGLTPGRAYEITVEPGFGSQYMRTSSVVTATEGTTVLDIALSGGGTIEGFVLTASGEAIRGANVDAFWQPEMAHGPGPGGSGHPPEFPASGGFGHAVTDANGYYRIGGLAAGTFGMFVRPPPGTSYTNAHLDPFRDDLPDVVLGETTSVSFTLGAGGSIRACVLTPDGQPVNNAWVSAHSFETGFGGGEPTRSPNGCADIRGVRAGVYDLEVNPPPGSPYGRQMVEDVVVSEGQTVSLEITLSAGTFIHGRVLDGNGDGIQHVFVNAFQITDGPGGPGAFGFAITGPDGSYNLTGLAPGRYGMHVNPPFGSTLSSKFLPEISVDEDGVEQIVRLGGGGTITGRVVVGGQGLANAWVGAFSFEGNSGGGTQTNGTGHFTIGGLTAATDYNLDVFPPFDRQDLAGYHSPTFLAVTEGQTTTVADIALGTGGTLTGRVVDANGRGVQFAFINVNGDGTFGWGSTDSGGNFSVKGLSASPGQQLEIFVQPGPGAAFVGSKTTHAWAPNADSVSNAGTITVGAGVNLTGRVTRGGVGVSDVDVFVWPTLPYHGPPIGGQATTGPGGWYNVTGLPSGQSWDVSVQPRDGSAGVFTANATTTTGALTFHNVTLGGGGNLAVQVMTGGTPIQGALVDCFSPTLRAGRGNTTVASGWANATGLPAGAYECRIFADGYAPTLRHTNVTADQTQREFVNLTQVPTFTVRGNFTPASGNASGYFVLIVPNGTIEDEEMTGFNTTSSTGAWVVHGLPAGRYDVLVLNGSGDVVASRPNQDIAGHTDVGVLTGS